jgi:hypothetical protein
MQHISCQGGVFYVKERKLPGSLKISGGREAIHCTKIGKTAVILHRLDHGLRSGPMPQRRGLGEAQESEVKPIGEAGFLLLSISALREVGLGGNLRSLIIG